MRINHEELKDLFKHFRWIDNIPEDQNKRDEICVEAKAALLLEANITSEMFPAFLRGAQFLHRDYIRTVCLLPSPVTFEAGKYPCFSGHKTVSLSNFEYGCVNDMGRLWGPDLGILAYIDILKEDDKPNDFPAIPEAQARARAQISRRYFYFKYPSFYSICKGLTPYKTPAEICCFWGCSAEPFAKIELPNMRPDHIGRTASLMGSSQDAFIDPEYVQDQRNFPQLIPCQSPLLTDLFFDDRYQDGWYCQVFSFRNEYGEDIMKLIKVYDRNTQNKYLLPVTTWSWNSGSISSQIFCVPYPSDKMPLYNLDLLLKPECKTVILSDSVELADANEHDTGFEDNVFTSFICSPGKYDQVDWSPLRDKDIVILVSNHSGMDLASAALKAKELREYLREQQDFEPALAVMPVDYGKNRALAFNNVDDIINRFKRTPPIVNPDDLRIIETKTEMEDFFRNAEEEVNKLPDE